MTGLTLDRPPVAEAAARGIKALLNAQRTGGYWTDFHVFRVPGTEWISGLVLEALAAQPGTADGTG